MMKNLHYIPFSSESCALSNERREKAESAHAERLAKAAYKNITTGKKQDTGFIGRQYEPHVRGMMTAHGLTAEADFRARTASKSDCIVYINGKRYDVEVKTGGGIIGTAEKAGLAAFEGIPEPDMCLVGKDLIVYCARADKLETEDDIRAYSIVMDRETFLRFIVEYGPKRKKVWSAAVQLATNNSYFRQLNKEAKAAGSPARLYDSVSIQSQNVDTLDVEIRAGIENGKFESLGAWLERNGRK